MLSKARADDAPSIKTVTLARASLAAATAAAAATASKSPPAAAGLGAPSSLTPASAARLLVQVGVLEMVEADPRPAFVVDAGAAGSATATEGGSLNVIFANSALRSIPGLAFAVAGKPSGSASGSASPATASTSPLDGYAQFKEWVLGPSAVGGSPAPGAGPQRLQQRTFAFAGTVWSAVSLRGRIRVISGNSTSAAAEADATTPTFDGATGSVAAVLSDGVASPPPRLVEEAEVQDYFGNATVSDLETAAPLASVSEEVAPPVVSTIEPHDPPKDPPRSKPNSEVAFGADDEVLYPEAAILAPHFAPEHLDDAATVAAAALAAGIPKEIGFFDWTRLPASDDLPAHIQFARSVDWASTALGPIEYWSSDLRQMCNLIMASPHPAAMYWGEDLVAIYNEAYVLLAGQKHPRLMGQSYREAWSEIWDEVKGVFANAKTTGQATMKDDDCLFIFRQGFLEETYFSWSIIPMVGADGSVTGLYNPAFEKTRRKIAERRMLTLREVGERTANARDVKGFWQQALTALDSNELDTPFVLVYSVSEEADSEDSSSIHSASLLGSKQCFLEGALGVPTGHRAAPAQIDLKHGMEGFGPVFREVMKTDRPVLLDVGTGDLPVEMLEGIEWRGFGDACRAVVVCPIHPTTGEASLGFLVVGVNPRRPYDDDYGLFIQLLSRQLATSLASVVLFEEEIRRGQRAAKLAAQDRIMLSEQLAARTQEARDSETRFTRMAEFSPAGLFIADSQGHVIFCNDAWYEITRVSKDGASVDRWIDAVASEDQERVRRTWATLVEDVEPVTDEFRFKAPWEDRAGNRSETWVLFAAYPEKDDNGALKSVFGSITNISQQKWAEGWQKRKMEEAVELKRQQENFIDITSHEMRNPLSAILQCADEIATTLGEFRASGQRRIGDELLASSVDAAQTIGLCAQHQKRIVDDVLTLSKLDSAMLMVTPVDVQPLTVVQRALKMFENELATADIRMDFVLDDSFKELGIDWVRIDPSRVLQVLINLTTNAIKFTTSESRRTITVTLAASLENPSKDPGAVVRYFPSRAQPADMTRGPDWGPGEEIYLQFAVRDTGRGLTAEEKKLLFLRFSQASPRTHVQYGGSGLGLFISRELTELQGGEIGVASEAGKGSTFAFYIRARRSVAPRDQAEAPLPLPLAGLARATAAAATATATAAADKPDRERGAGGAGGGAPKVRDFAPPTGAESSAGADDGTPLSVLIVEDNLVNQKVLGKQLRNRGFGVRVANHGVEGLDALRASQFWFENAKAGAGGGGGAAAAAAAAAAEIHKIDVVLMDQEMPVMNGLACTRQIREWEQRGQVVGHVPIIAVTANARMEQIAALLAAGMDDVVSKPFRIPELVPKIQELAAKYPSAALCSRRGGEGLENGGEGQQQQLDWAPPPPSKI
ncbi:hypothetical protein BDY21DRAFT_319481 [Lineolata rhizophorae]|uniref:Uncharacterized protein n=1 Tax=Lineolata rhizophorae TaxID=578093 RepID=A0A6A6P330_9PEZI|nr:hypothetical protein BDY21DRAFT_319481 [Lineolata rhizophorae]